MLEIKEQEKLKLKLYGNEFELIKPTRKVAVEMQEKLSTDEGKAKSIDIIGDLLVACGLPKEVCDDLQLDHMQLILEHLMGAKKK